MGQVRLGITMSLDGFVAGPRQRLEAPLGEGGTALHEWVVAVRTWRRMHGMEGGATGQDDEVAAEAWEGIGATVMGRNMFGPERGPWGEDPWRGWWGDDPPFHHPVFVLTHHPREPLQMAGGTTFHFVTDGIDSALARARAAAGDGDVGIGGGAATARAYLAAGLVDVFEVHVAPIVLGSGERLFEGLDELPRTYVRDRVLASPTVTHVRFHRRGADDPPAG